MESKHGKLYAVGLGPGDPAQLTAQARAALAESEVIVGYQTYLNLIRELIEGKKILASGMREEVARAHAAVQEATSGKVVAVVSSGDPGIYGMAGLIYEVLQESGWHPRSDLKVEIVPGVAALNAASALLGAPLMQDFAAISLSDLLTPWAVIARRLELAAQADFVIVLYNPRSAGRNWQLVEAYQILCRYRAPETPVGVVHSAYRESEQVIVTDLQRLLEHKVDMQTTVIIGNSTTFSLEGLIVTPRGYKAKYDLKLRSKKDKPAR